MTYLLLNTLPLYSFVQHPVDINLWSPIFCRVIVFTIGIIIINDTFSLFLHIKQADKTKEEANSTILLFVITVEFIYMHIQDHNIKHSMLLHSV